jgi:hypothetical protein
MADNTGKLLDVLDLLGRAREAKKLARETQVTIEQLVKDRDAHQAASESYFRDANSIMYDIADVE